MLNETMRGLRGLHNRINQTKLITKDTADLTQLQNSIAPALREYYLKEKHHGQTLAFANELNSYFRVIAGIVKSYRVELGTGLELSLEGYSGLMVQQYENFYKRKL